MPDLQIDIRHLLIRLPLLQELTERQLDELASVSRERRLAKGELLFHKGDAVSGFYVLVFGQIKLAITSPQGNEKVVEILGPRQSFGEAVMFMERPYPVSAEAILDSMVVHIASAGVFALLASDTLFAKRMLAGMSMRMHSLLMDVESYSLRSSVQRVIGYLLQQCVAEDATSASLVISLPAAKTLIASRLNLTPETLSRVFHELTVSGLIDVQGKQITIIDIHKLRQYDF